MRVVGFVTIAIVTLARLIVIAHATASLSGSLALLWSRLDCQIVDNVITGSEMKQFLDEADGSDYDLSVAQRAVQWWDLDRDGTRRFHGLLLVKTKL